MAQLRQKYGSCVPIGTLWLWIYTGLLLCPSSTALHTYRGSTRILIKTPPMLSTSSSSVPLIEPETAPGQQTLLSPDDRTPASRTFCSTARCSPRRSRIERSRLSRTIARQYRLSGSVWFHFRSGRSTKPTEQRNRLSINFGR
jgi:hypothetical protein